MDINGGESIDDIVINAIDQRIKLLSHSSLQLLNRCDREFQLHRLGIKSETELTDDEKITFEFGHMVGEGIQLAIQGYEEDTILYTLFTLWKMNLFAANDRQKKSFFYGLFAVQKFIHMYKHKIILEDYELLYVTNQHGIKKPACEIAFKIHFPHGFTYRGAIDAILKHTETGEILVLEVKTTSFSPVQPAIYAHSDQGIGYSVVLDKIFKDLSSYKVLYFVYSTKDFEFTPLPFIKTHGMRAFWIQSTLNRIDRIIQNEKTVYPTNGDSCLRFFKECPHLNTCGLSTSLLATDHERDVLDEEAKKVYDYEFQLADLIESQLSSIDIQ